MDANRISAIRRNDAEVHDDKLTLIRVSNIEYRILVQGVKIVTYCIKHYAQMWDSLDSRHKEKD